MMTELGMVVGFSALCRHILAPSFATCFATAWHLAYLQR